mmetsp:Transcript_31582/g.75702  ORF Transcript_31582/g.75702 Transcript_31582/m.75702 type:complete len:475 (+) Transcript_31582:38-1462(+)
MFVPDWAAWLFEIHPAYLWTFAVSISITGVLGYLTRPGAKEQSLEATPAYREFEKNFLTAWCLCAMADWLQGPYVYALYAEYGYPREEIAQLFVAGFGASCVGGIFAGAMADKYGRRFASHMYCVLYIVACVTKHFNHYWILMLGRVTGGVATSLLFSVFESWAVSELTVRHKVGSKLQQHLFGMMFYVNFLAAIAAGIVAQALVSTVPMRPGNTPAANDRGIYFGGMTTPFDASIICLVAGGSVIWAKWKENYGSAEPSAEAAQANGGGAWYAYWPLWVVGLIVAFFEGSMYIFVFNWTPALSPSGHTPPHGLVFAMFMMISMCGSSTFSLIDGQVDAKHLAMPIFGFGAVCLFVAMLALSMPLATMIPVMLVSLQGFEFCVGMYFPVIATIKSRVVPEHVRATAYNCYRVPLNAIVVAILLVDMSLAASFRWCVFMLCCAAGLMVPLRSVMAEGEREQKSESYGAVEESKLV